MAGSPVMAVLDTSEDIVDCPDTFRSDPYCTAGQLALEGAERSCKKPIAIYTYTANMLAFRSRPAGMFIQHFLVFWLIL